MAVGAVPSYRLYSWTVTGRHVFIAILQFDFSFLIVHLRNPAILILNNRLSDILGYSSRTICLNKKSDYQVAAYVMFVKKLYSSSEYREYCDIEPGRGGLLIKNCGHGTGFVEFS